MKLKTPAPVIIAVLTVITVVFWIIFGVVRIITKPAEVNVPAEILEPIVPSLNVTVLGEVTGRVYFTDAEIPSTPVILSTPEPVVTAPATQVTTSIPIDTATPVPTATPDVTPPPDDTGQ